MNTPIAMPKPTGSAKKPPSVQKEDAMWLQKELINKNYMELATARANNRKVSATFVPGNLNELLMCFDFARSLPETNALQNGMPYTAMQNAAGNWVEPSAETFAAAAASADWASAKDFNLVITNAPGDQAWPITATNFMLMQKKPKDAKRNQDTLAFFKWAFENGQAQANELHYVPLPAELVKQIEAYWATDLK